MDELTDRLHGQLEMPPPAMKICRGRMYSRAGYEIDVKERGSPKSAAKASTARTDIVRAR